MRSRTVSFLFLAMMVLFGAAGCTTTARKHPEYDLKIKNVENVAMMPRNVEIELRSGASVERLHAQESNIKTILSDLIGNELRLRGFNIVPNKLDKANIIDMPDMRNRLFHVQKVCEHTLTKMYRPNRSLDEQVALNYNATMGSETEFFADRCQSDALVFSCLYGYKKSAGEQLGDFVTSVLIGALTGVAPIKASSGAVLYVVIVDGKTGDVLWSNTGEYPYCKFNRNDMDILVTHIFKQFPEATEGS